MGNVRIGQCKLTGTRGRYVNAHIIPEALTETLWNSKPLTQIGRYGRRIKRWTTWYDSRLVTAEGEAILARYDLLAKFPPRVSAFFNRPDLPESPGNKSRRAPFLPRLPWADGQAVKLALAD